MKRRLLTLNDQFQHKRLPVSKQATNQDSSHWLLFPWCRGFLPSPLVSVFSCNERHDFTHRCFLNGCPSQNMFRAKAFLCLYLTRLDSQLRRGYAPSRTQTTRGEPAPPTADPRINSETYRRLRPGRSGSRKLSPFCKIGSRSGILPKARAPAA